MADSVKYVENALKGIDGVLHNLWEERSRMCKEHLDNWEWEKAYDNLPQLKALGKFRSEVNELGEKWRKDLAGQMFKLESPTDHKQPVTAETGPEEKEQDKPDPKEHTRQNYYGRAAPGTFTPTEKYEREIIRVLLDLGGTSKAGKVVKKLHNRMDAYLTPTDYAKYPSTGQARWYVMARQAGGVNLKKKGILRQDRKKGVWELKDIAWAESLVFNREIPVMSRPESVELSE